MANTVSILTYTNTFGDWVNKTNALANEVTDIGKNNFHKDTGTLFLDAPVTGLQVANNAIIAGQLQVQGTGSSVYIQKNLTVDTGQVYFSNTTLGLTNAGNAIIGKVLTVNGSGTGLNVANNVLIGGTTIINGSGTGLNVANNVLIGEQSTANNTTTTNQTDSGTLIVNADASIGNDLSIANYTLTRILQANSKVNTATLSVTGTGFLNVVQANTVVNTATLSVTGSGFLDIVQANTSVNTATLSVDGTSYLNVIQANTSVNTALLTITNTLDATNADGTFNNLQAIGQLSVGGNFVITGSTVYTTNNFTLNAGSAFGALGYFNVNRGSTGANSSIRWNEPTKYWDILDVSNSTYYRILTNQNLSDSVSTANSTIIATAQAANTLNESIKTANTSLKSYVDTNVSSLQGQITSNVSSLQSQITSNVNVLNASVTSAYQRANTSANSFIGTTGSITPSSGVVTFTSDNGVTAVGSGSTITINTAQDLRTTASPTFAALTLTAPLSISQGGTGAQSRGDSLTALLPTGTTAGYVLTTGGPGSFSWSAPTGGGSSGATPGTAINSSRLTTTSASSNQTIFASPVFVAGANQVRLYIDGVRQFDGYTETITTASFTGSISVTGVLTVTGIVTGTITNGMTLSGSGINNGVTITSLGTGTGGTGTYNTNQLLVATSTVIVGSAYSIVLSTGVATGDAVLVEVDGYYVNPYYANNITFTAPQGGIVSTANTIQLAIADLESRKATLISPALTGVPTSITPPVSVSGNTMIATTAFVYSALANTSSTYTHSITGSSGSTSAALTFAGMGGSVIGSTFNGSSAKIVDYSTVGAAAVDQTMYIGTSSVKVNRSSGALTLTGITSIDGTAAGLSVTLAVTSGGTGVTTSTGTGSNVLSTSPTLVTPVLGTPSSGNFSTGTFTWPTFNQNTTGTATGFTSTTQNSQFNSIGVGTAASATAGEIRATNNITAYYSDKRLKENITNISGALEKLKLINGVTYNSNDVAESFGYTDRSLQVGVIAQEIQEILPQAVKLAPFDTDYINGKEFSKSGDYYLTVQYEKIIPLLIEAIKDLSKEIEILKGN